MTKTLLFILLLPFTFLASAQNPPKRELRGAWIATYLNIDWPSRTQTPAQQKTALITILDHHAATGINAVYLQMRSQCDAMYPSSIEPWSADLNGVQGRAPTPFWDPLEFAIAETHKRGMEFHAWLNPYRANYDVRSASIASNHITKIHPEWFLTYGGKKYFDPGNKEAQQHVINVVKDIVKRYNVDAIHMDDYFYPYRIPNKEFPDNASYKKSGTSLSKGDWRRSNVDSIIKALNAVIKAEKPYCKFGISPFGVWRNKEADPDGSNTQAGQTNYDDLYADILLWLKQGWVDYVAPQLYWEIGHKLADYEELIRWWSEHSYGRHIYIGHGIYRTNERNPAWKNPNELPNQLKILRETPNVKGSIYFSSTSFDRNPNGWNDSLRNNYYKYPAVVPQMSWLPQRDIGKR